MERCSAFQCVGWGVDEPVSSWASNSWDTSFSIYHSIMNKPLLKTRYKIPKFLQICCPSNQGTVGCLSLWVCDHSKDHTDDNLVQMTSSLVPVDSSCITKLCLCLYSAAVFKYVVWSTWLTSIALMSVIHSSSHHETDSHHDKHVKLSTNSSFHK